MKRMQKILNKWQFIWNWGPCEWAFGGHQFVVALIKIISFPDFGHSISKKNFKGMGIVISTWPYGIRMRRSQVWFMAIEYPLDWRIFKPSTWVRRIGYGSYI